MTMRDPLGAAWLVLAGFVLGAVLTAVAVAPRGSDVAVAVDAGTPDGGRSMLAAPARARLAAGTVIAIDCDATDEHVAGCER